MTTAPTTDQSTRDAIMTMIGFARSGRLTDSRTFGKTALSTVGEPAPIHALLGRMACESGDFADGIKHLEEAIANLPNDPVVRTDLVAALIHEGRFSDAVAAASAEYYQADPSLQLARFRGYAAQQVEDFETASAAYRWVVERAPGDAGTWNNLGNAEAALGQFDDAVQSLEQAMKLDPSAAPTRINLARAVLNSGRRSDALAILEKAAKDFPDQAQIQYELGRLAGSAGNTPLAVESFEQANRLQPNDPDTLAKLATQRGIQWDMEGARSAYNEALRLSPAMPEAHIGLAMIQEHDNKAGELTAIADTARTAGVPPDAQSFLDALVYRRDKKWEDGLAAAERSSPSYDAIRRAQLIGEFNDRLDRPAAAFAAFSEMNRLAAEAPHGPLQLAEQYRDQLVHNHATLTREWLDRWTPAVPPGSDERPSPVFLFGFPRSGTTLLDTMLMGHSKVRVLEEKPAFPNVERSLGPIENLATMDAAAIREARDRYWAEVAKIEDVPADAMLIDKSPLYLNKIAYIHRLFPDAKFILALRHPMDVVLSCFITNFRPNAAMANFLDLQRTAEIYDLSFSSFEEAERLLGIPVHPVVYERMVDDRDEELRPLFDWLGLSWEAEAVDHQATAAKRGTITTASYAQVHEPLYKRAAGRWARYRDQLQPVAHLLRPWAERLGYSIDDPEQVPPRATDGER